MRRSMVSFVLLLFIVFFGLAFYGYLSFTVERGDSASVVAVADQAPVAASKPITAGVILTGDASRFGWGDLVFAGDYADLTLAGQRVVVYENFNPTIRPGTTLEQVVNNIAEYAGPDVIFLSVGRLTPDEIKIDERYANTVFIMNLATRADVETLLTVLPATDADINRTVVGEEEIAAAPPLESAPAAETPAQDTGTTSDANPGSIPRVLIVMLIALVMVGGIFGRWWKRFDPVGGYAPAKSAKKKTKRQLSAGLHAKILAIEEAARAHATDFAAIGEAKPVIHKFSTYVIGDDHYDESFPVELPDNTFLGECGVSIAAPVNRYDKGRVTAFEAWLFDKNDIRTMSAGLFSEHAVSDHTLRRQLDASAQVIEAKPGMAIQLETDSLRIRICVLDQQYGFSDTLPPRSFFEYLVVELAVWQK